MSRASARTAVQIALEVDVADDNRVAALGLLTLGPDRILRLPALRELLLHPELSAASITWARLQAVQFEGEDEPQLRVVRLVSDSAVVGDPVRVTVAGVEVEGRIEAVESSTLRVRVGRRLF